jgi:hypothetical protein
MNIRGFIGRAVRAPSASKCAASMLAGAAVASSVAGWALAEPPAAPRGVIELFTSQGCSSCPPADTVFSQLVEKGDVVALAYHVDYWDYLGWRDTFAKPENTARQYDYMKAFKAQSVYTPQAVINGRKHVNGSSKEDIDQALERLKGSNGGLSVDVRATKRGSSLMIEADAATNGPREAEVIIVYFDPPTPVEIDRGENTGKTVTYWNAVTDVQVAGVWHGKSASFELPMREVTKKATGGYAVLLQTANADGSPGPIIGASIVREPQS